MAILPRWPRALWQVTQVTRTTTSLLGRLFCSDSQLWIRKRYSHQKHRWYNLSWLSIYFPFVFSFQHHNTYDNDILRQIHHPLTHIVVFLHLARHLNFSSPLFPYDQALWFVFRNSSTNIQSTHVQQSTNQDHMSEI